MALNNTQVDKRRKDLVGQMQDCINEIETEFMQPEDTFNKSKVAFYVGRIEQIFLEVGNLSDWFKEIKRRK